MRWSLAALVFLTACARSVTPEDAGSDASLGELDAEIDASVALDGGSDASLACTTGAPTITGLTALGGSGLEVVTAVGASPVDGSFFVAGHFTGDAFGTSPPVVSANAFHLTLRTGVTTSALRVYASDTGSEALGAALDTHGSVTIGGTLHGGTASVERMPIDTGTGADTGLVVRLVTGMAPSVEVLAPTGGMARVNAVSRRGDGYLVAGELEGSLAIGSEHCMASDRDAFVAAFTFEGTIDWLRCFGGPGTQRVRGVAIQNAGDVYVVGDFSSAITIDASPSIAARGVSDAFVARFDGAGAPVWLQTIGTPDSSNAESLVRVVASGARVLAVGVLGDGDTGLVVADPARGGPDGALVVLDASSGDVLRVARYGGVDDDALTDIAVDRCGQAWIVGAADNTFGRGLLESFDSSTLAPRTGPERDPRDVMIPSAVGVSVDGTSILVAGTYEGAPMLAGTTLPASLGPSDLFLMTLAR